MMISIIIIPLSVLILTISHLSGEVWGIQPTQNAPPNQLFPVLFESNRVLVVRKPHGIGHHDELSSSMVLDGGDHGDHDSIIPGVIRLLRSERQHQAAEEGERLYGIHRLDKVTSGILVLAKDASTASTLSDYFARGEIQKVYFGLSAKKPKKKKQGLVQGGMKRSRNKSWKLIRTQKGGNKSQDLFAKTRFFTTGLQYNAVMNDGGEVDTSNIDTVTNAKTVAMFRPYTGRTHQLRVAAKAMGIPLLGDPIYKDGGGGNGIDTDYTTITNTRTMLHSSGIHIPKFLDHAEINVWCSPTFFHDDEDAINDGPMQDVGLDTRKNRFLLAESLDVAVAKLMTKNCDVPGILEAMTTHPTISSNGDDH